MKVTIQNGSKNGFSRQEVEAMLKVFPASWQNAVTQLVLYQSTDDELKITFYAKAKTLGLFWPTAGAPILREKGLEELLLALSIASEMGYLPTKITKTVRNKHLQELEEIRALCMTALQPKTA